MTYSKTKPFCDWLTVTQRPDDNCLSSLGDMMLSSGAVLERYKSNEYSYRVGENGYSSGSLRVTERKNFVSISASGSVLAYLRVYGMLNDYLSILSESPHKVTRLDATVDVLRDTPDVLEELREAYPDGKIKLTRKAIKISTLTSVRDDGRSSGSFYAGGKGSKAGVTACVYDKQLERQEKAGIEICPTTRYELKFGRGYGCTLKDAHDPYALFYSHASPLLISMPDPIPDWSPNGSEYAYGVIPRVDRLPAEAMADLVERSADIDTLLLLADKSGSEGRKYLLRLLTTRLEKTSPLSPGETL